MVEQQTLINTLNPKIMKNDIIIAKEIEKGKKTLQQNTALNQMKKNIWKILKENTMSFLSIRMYYE